MGVCLRMWLNSSRPVSSDWEEARAEQAPILNEAVSLIKKERQLLEVLSKQHKGGESHDGIYAYSNGRGCGIHSRVL